jgi:hypothetical protein
MVFHKCFRSNNKQRSLVQTKAEPSDERRGSFASMDLLGLSHYNLDPVDMELIAALHHRNSMFIICDSMQAHCPVVFASKQFYAYTGYYAEDFSDVFCISSFLERLGTSTDSIARLHSTLHSCRPKPIKIVNYKRNGQAFVNQMCLSPIHDVNGKCVGLLATQSVIAELPTDPTRFNEDLNRFTLPRRVI